MNSQTNAPYDERTQRLIDSAKQATRRAAEETAAYYATNPRRERTRVQNWLEAIQAPFCTLFKKIFFPFAP